MINSYHYTLSFTAFANKKVMIFMVNNVSFAAHSGCMNGNGSDYRDAAMYTQSGYKCLSWEDMASQSVNPQTYPDAGKTS